MRILLGMVALIAAMMTAPLAHADPGDTDVRDRTSAPPVQESLKRPGCTNFYETDTDHVESSITLDTWVDLRTKIYARQCKSRVSARRWVDPVNVQFYYNTKGSHESCGFFDTFEGVRYDLYIKDGTGANYHLPTVVLDCEEDTTGYEIKSLASSGNFVMCGTGPSWKTNWTIKVDNANDKSGSMGGSLWHFIGPVPDDPKCH